jgi:hypothetical protein
VTSPASGADCAADLPDYAPVPRSGLGPALNEQGHYVGRVERIAAANGVPSTVTHLVYSHHHHDHAGAASLFGEDVVRVGHEETEDVPGYMAAPATVLSYPWTHFICGPLGRLATRDDVSVHQAYVADIEASGEALASVNPVPFYMHYPENAWAGVKAHLDSGPSGPVHPDHHAPGPVGGCPGAGLTDELVAAGTRSACCLSASRMPG